MGRVNSILVYNAKFSGASRGTGVSKIDIGITDRGYPECS